jgi:hypothetical protein
MQLGARTLARTDPPLATVHGKGITRKGITEEEDIEGGRAPGGGSRGKGRIHRGREGYKGEAKDTKGEAYRSTTCPGTPSPRPARGCPTCSRAAGQAGCGPFAAERRAWSAPGACEKWASGSAAVDQA